MFTVKRYTALMTMLVAIHLGTVSPARASSEDGLEDVLVGAGAITGGACAAVGAAAWLNSPSEDPLEKRSEALYEHVYAIYGQDIKTLEDTLTGDISDLSYQKKQELIHTVSEKALARLAPQMNAGVDAYCADIDRALSDVEHTLKKITKRLCKKTKNVFLSEMAQALENLMLKLKFLSRYVEEHADYFSLKATAESLYEQYEQEVDIYKKYQDYSLATKDLQALVMEYGHDVQSSFPYVAYAKKVMADKKLVQEAITKTAGIYIQLEAEYKKLQECLTALAHEVMAHPSYAQSLRDKQDLEQKRLLQRQQERLQAENQRLMSELALEKRRPTVVVEHEYRVPVAYVQPVALEYEYVGCDTCDDYWSVEVDF